DDPPARRGIGGGLGRAPRDDRADGLRPAYRRRSGPAHALSPLSLARKLSGTRLTHDLHEHPTLVTGALEAITETVMRFAALALAEGVSGIFYSIQAASRSVSSEEDYACFGEPYDRRVLASVQGDRKS